MHERVERLDGIEERVSELTEAVRSLERRLAALESGAEPRVEAGASPGAVPTTLAPPAPGPPGPPPPATDAPELTVVVSSWVSLTGRSFLVLGGAYLIRLLTESGTLPPAAGVAMGLVYAATFAVLAARSADLLAASFHGFLSLLIGYPLLWEATARLHILPPPLSAALLGVLAAGVTGAAFRRDLRTLAWGALLGAIGTSFGLLASTSAIASYTTLLLLVGAGSLWLTYGRKWHGLRWPAALAADAAVLLMTTLAAWPGGPPEAYRGLSPAAATSLAIALLLVYPGSFAARTLIRHRSVNVFEVVQTALALLVGLGGAARIAQATGTGVVTLGAASLILAACGYAVAFAFVERQAEAARNFLFFTSVSLVLALYGGRLLAGGPLLPFVWGGLGLLAAAGGARFGRQSLAAHGAIYLTAAALVSGLLAASRDALASAPPWRPMDVEAWSVLFASVVAYLLVSLRLDRNAPVRARLAGLALALVSVVGLGAAAVGLITSILGQDPGTLAAARTFVLAAGAVSLGYLRTRTTLAELGWIAWPLLAAGALKILLEDLPAGRPATLFPAFVFYGLALLLAPRLLRRQQAKE